MVVIVENRLLADKPIEFKALKEIRKRISETSERNEKLLEENKHMSNCLSTALSDLHSVAVEINNAKDLLVQTTVETNAERDALAKVNQKISDKITGANIGGATVDIDGAHLLELITAKITMERLEAGGVDNWEWFGESIGDDIDEAASEELSQLPVAINI
jgi:hypothetical protein